MRHMTFLRGSIEWSFGISHLYLPKRLVAVPIRYLQLIVWGRLAYIYLFFLFIFIILYFSSCFSLPLIN